MTLVCSISADAGHCLCTATLYYLSNQLTSINYMIKTLRKGGFLLFDHKDKKAYLQLADKIQSEFEKTYVIFYSSKKIEQDTKTIFTKVLVRPTSSVLDFSDLGESEYSLLMEKIRLKCIQVLLKKTTTIV